MTIGDTILLASILAASAGGAAMIWLVVNIGIKDRYMAAQIETANLERAMRAMEEADDGRS